MLAHEPSTAVAVVIPCFNDGRYLQEALNSLYAQSCGDWEAVVVDDGSTDPRTLNVLDAINHPRVLVHRHEKNRGLAAARNTGVKLTKAPIVFPLDADKLIFRSISLREAWISLREKPAFPKYNS